MKIYYIGAFPPVYGGVTIKNQNLYEALSRDLDICKIDMNRIKRFDIREILRFGWVMLTGKQYIIGLAGQKNRRQFTKLMYRFKRSAMSRSVMLVMGGVVEDVAAAGDAFVRMMNGYRRVYVELPGMQERLERAGVINCGIYPNGRPRPQELPDPKTPSDALECVFFSIIQPEKGVDLILQTADLMPQTRFHFYGELRKDYEQEFLCAIQNKANVTYHGVFRGDADGVYRELRQYDVLLLPTRWKAEGLPGILVEAKIAGVPAVVSDHNFNAQIVNHDYDGLVIREITAEKLTSVLTQLQGNSEKLMKMKIASRAAAERYYIDVCAADMIRELKRG